MRSDHGVSFVERDAQGVVAAFREDVLQGLSEPQKAVPARWFYDEAGSTLFEQITELPEYYPTRAEVEILGRYGADFREWAGAGRAVVEFGSGSSSKTPLLLDAIAPAAYVPIDISGDFLRASAALLAAKLPGLTIYPVEADFMRGIELPAAVAGMPKLGFFPGSTIGNMVPATATDLLRTMRAMLGDGSKLLIGFDLIKDPAVLVAAYDDPAGVTAAFNLNLAQRINRELAGTIPVGELRHLAVWNDDLARIEMHLKAGRNIEFEVSGRPFAMADGETIHTENSHKFSLRSASMLLLSGGWTPRKRWLDSSDRFALVLADATIPRSAP